MPRLQREAVLARCDDVRIGDDQRSRPRTQRRDQRRLRHRGPALAAEEQEPVGGQQAGLGTERRDIGVDAV
jgi:hypothetical protein